MKQDFPSQLLQRTLAILSAFRHGDRELTVAEISERAGVPKSTTYRLISELVELGLLERTERAVSLGVSLFELGQLAASHRHSIREIALPHLADLREATHQTIHLAVLRETEVVYVEILPARNSPPLPSRVGGRLPAHATALGKALLAHAPGGVTERILAGGLTPVGPDTVCDETDLRRQIARIRSTNVSYDNQESYSGIVCVASAITVASDAPVAAVSVSGWYDRVDPQRLGPLVRATATAITRSARQGCVRSLDSRHSHAVLQNI
ncbi:IclR family transcriptional regulator [Rhodococcus sp. NPDC057529]|uniref:IclR family transcriptional regulator n=1 Tax=Rhodococcus sp. NPDC057529 TaxID=3346158 RepID=UPI00366C4189